MLARGVGFFLGLLKGVVVAGLGPTRVMVRLPALCSERLGSLRCCAGGFGEPGVDRWVRSGKAGRNVGDATLSCICGSVL